MSHDHGHSNVVNAQATSSVIEVDIRNAHDASEYAGLEEHLRGLPGINALLLNRVRFAANKQIIA